MKSFGLGGEACKAQLRYLSVGVRPPPVAGLNRSRENVLRFDHQPVAPASAPAAPRNGVKRSEKPLITKKPFTASTWFKNIQPAITSALKWSVRTSALPDATRT